MGTAIYWLTRDFRLADNVALAAAATEGQVAPVFLIDDQLLARGSADRWRTERGLAALDAAFNARFGFGILVMRGEADRVLPDLARRIGARSIHANDWPCAEMAGVQDRLHRALEGSATRLHLHPGHLLIHPRRLRTGQGGAYRVYTPFARAAWAAGPDRPITMPDRITGCTGLSAGLDITTLSLAPDMHKGRPVLQRHALPAGEAAAFARLDDFLDRAANYGADRDRPDIDATSGLSEHLAHGEISPRSVWAAAEARSLTDPTRAPGITKFMSELLWREFAWHLLIEFPQMPSQEWQPSWVRFPWRGVNTDATRWQHADTGVALVDAGLREMRVTGRMHNRVRMVVASYLTKHLLTDWRLGLGHFADSLTDWDPAANAMNWQWVAGCGPDSAPFFRIFNPDRQAEQFDPKGRYRSRWLAGWQGSDQTTAQDYLTTLPRDWPVAARYTERPKAGPLAQGRAAALEAYARMREV